MGSKAGGVVVLTGFPRLPEQVSGLVSSPPLPLRLHPRSTKLNDWIIGIHRSQTHWIVLD
jgi:hypothetical protein